HAVVHRLEQRGLDAEIGVYGSELGTDHAAADDGDPLGQLCRVTVGGMVGIDHFDAVDVHARDTPRHRPGADDHRPALEVLTVDLDRAVVLQGARAQDHLHLAALEQTGQATVQLLDDARLAGV